MFWIFLLGAAAIVVMMTRMRIGLSIVMFGSNSRATFYSGISSFKVIIFTYVFTATAASVAGLFMSSRSGSATAGYGSSYLLLAITIAVLGGTSPTGGKVAIAGTVLATLLLQMLSSGFNMLQVSPYIYQLAQGCILIGVLVIELRGSGLPRAVRRFTAPATISPTDPPEA